MCFFGRGSRFRKSGRAFPITQKIASKASSWAGFCLVIGDVSQKFPHEVGLAGGTPLQTVLAEMVTATRKWSMGTRTLDWKLRQRNSTAGRGWSVARRFPAGLVHLNWPTLTHRHHLEYRSTFHLFLSVVLASTYGARLRRCAILAQSVRKLHPRNAPMP